MSRYTPYNTEIVDINNLKKEKVKLPFTKMSACSNDYIYINCFERRSFLSGVPLHLPRPTATTASAATASSSSARHDVADAQMRMFNLRRQRGSSCAATASAASQSTSSTTASLRARRWAGPHVINIETKERHQVLQHHDDERQGRTRLRSIWARQRFARSRCP